MLLILFSVAALAFLAWQAFLTFDEEVRYIWAYVPICLGQQVQVPDPCSMRNQNPFKWIYFYLRYGVIAAHV